MPITTRATPRDSTDAKVLTPNAVRNTGMTVASPNPAMKIAPPAPLPVNIAVKSAA